MEVRIDLTRRGIPFEVRSGIRFFEQSHVKDVTGFLRILVNPLDEMAWKRVLGLYPKIGCATAEKVEGLALRIRPPRCRRSSP